MPEDSIHYIDVNDPSDVPYNAEKDSTPLIDIAREVLKTIEIEMPERYDVAIEALVEAELISPGVETEIFATIYQMCHSYNLDFSLREQVKCLMSVHKIREETAYSYIIDFEKVKSLALHYRMGGELPF